VDAFTFRQGEYLQRTVVDLFYVAAHTLFVISFQLSRYIDQSACVDQEVRSIQDALLYQLRAMYIFVCQLVVGCAGDDLGLKPAY
jgi:hypothetical protein